MKRIVVLGSTGSIGTQTLDVVRRHPDKLQVVALAANSRAEELLAQAREFGVRHLAVGDERLAGEAVADDLRAQAEDGLRCAAAQAAVGVPGVAGARATQGGLRADAGASDASNANARSSDTERGEGSLGFGAQAVAALAYGTESVPAVDKIVGPGNIYVATAKRKVFGKVGIDMIAGPSEILVLADGGANPAWVAADLLSQAEHDKLATPVLVTDSEALAEAVQAELERQIPLLPRAAIARESVDTNGKIVVTDDLAKAIEAANLIAPEHLEICTEDPFAVLGSIKNAGSIFLGRNVPEALGDYFAGPNHTLPTSGTARFSSPLGVDDFVKKSSFIYYTKDALGAVQGRIADFAERKGLHAHAKSVTIRFEDEK